MDRFVKVVQTKGFFKSKYREEWVYVKRGITKKDILCIFGMMFEMLNSVEKISTNY